MENGSAKQSNVIERLKVLGEEISKLNNGISTLKGRLKLVLAQEPPKESKVEDKLTPVTLTEQLLALSDRVVHIHAEIEEIMGRLEI